MQLFSNCHEETEHCYRDQYKERKKGDISQDLFRRIQEIKWEIKPRLGMLKEQQQDVVSCQDKIESRNRILKTYTEGKKR